MQTHLPIGISENLQHFTLNPVQIIEEAELAKSLANSVEYSEMNEEGSDKRKKISVVIDTLDKIIIEWVIIY